MTKNPHIGSDALAFLDSIIPDTPENRLAERQEIFRIALTQAMRDARKRAGLTQKQLAEKLGVGQSWVSKLESANNDHTFESVIAYLNAFGADFEASILLEGQKATVVAAKLGMTKEEAYTVIEPAWESIEDSQPKEESNSPEFELIPPEEKNKCRKAQAVIARSGGLWSAA
jgi:transcriptional regulator with XRE-family HTH domain